MRHRSRQTLAAALCCVTVVACAGRSKADDGAAAAPAPRSAAPLAVFRAVPLVVTPVQRLRAADTPAWGAGDAGSTLAALDSSIATAVRARGATGWTFAADVERQARRNPTVAPDPHALAIDELMASRAPPQLTGPLGSQLRAIVALGGQRYALVPLELRWLGRADGRGEAVLRLVLVDTRLSKPLWTGDVRSAPADTYSRALLDGVAAHLADLISPPDGASGA
jgi:hypothetical protein